MDMSPSSRRAWIEISQNAWASGTARVALLAEGVDRNMAARWAGMDSEEVALLAEGVDRNLLGSSSGSTSLVSPSSRRAWIEIEHDLRHISGVGVALLAEGVDRNIKTIDK